MTLTKRRFRKSGCEVRVRCSVERMDAQNQASAVPTPTQKRIDAIDTLRGFALFGVLLANLLVFSYPSHLYPPLSSPGLSEGERYLEWLIRVFVEGSFYPLFSFLFGLGFAFGLRKGEAALPLFQRRLALLLLIGILHGIFIWWGDILTSYALLGFGLIPLRKLPARTLIGWVAGMLVLSVLLFWGAFGVDTDTLLPKGNIIDIYASGSYFEVTLQRLQDFSLVLASLPFYLPQILSFFLLGMLCGRSGWLEDIERHRRFWRRVLFGGVVVGLPIVALHAASLWNHEDVSLLRAVDGALGSPALGFVYFSTLTLLLRHPQWQRRSRPLAAVGRLALTNYLMQSLVMTLVFYGYGGGLYGELHLGWGVGLAILLFVLQMGFSTWWLAHFRYGPAEWVWRSLTYRRLLPLRKAS